ncbi:type IV pilus modification PilV family protein [Thalassotalea profundi]|uniref:MSHA biogenesis protein MshD n=1 Tax=Thalassotalea profundi TaxID=2036687 RepID=A0ABQ3J580_9GAMM|nr:type II secretion system protein [Thalassotalea profundi]GHE99180.1 MSHA biogenesis protein MshD [Thalassotalea profundi]
MRSNFHILSKGFTLIETIVGIVVLSISFSIIITLIYPTVEQSADQLHQIRAAELGQSLLNEITGHAFDENSDHSGSKYRCGENGIICSTDMKSEIGENRLLFDDVDDFNNLRFDANTVGSYIQNSQGENLTLYLGYSVTIMVCNDSDYDGNCATNADNDTAKLITVTVTTPTGFAIDFSTYKANF